MNCQKGLFLCKPLRKDLFRASLVGLPVMSGFCWLVEAEPWSLLSSSRCVLPVCVFVFKFPFCKHTSHIRFGLTLMTSSEFIMSATSCFQIRPHSEVIRVRTSTYIFGGGGRRGSKVPGGMAVSRFYLKMTVAQGQC